MKFAPFIKSNCRKFINVKFFLVADTQLYKRLCPSVRPSIGSGHRVEKWGNERFRYFLCMFECWGWVGVWMGVGCPCPPVRNDIVTPRHLFSCYLSRCCLLTMYLSHMTIALVFFYSLADCFSFKNAFAAVL